MTGQYVVGQRQIGDGPIEPIYLKVSDTCKCCPEHAERMRRMEERVRDLAVAVESFMTTVEPAMRMIGQPGGIASLLFKRK